MVRGVFLSGLTWALVGIGLAVAAEREIPPAFAPFEHMIGSWKGTGVPTANPLKGWPETHLWAWKFARGVPIGMSLELKGDKALAKGVLTFDDATKTYHLDGTDAEGKAVSYVGALERTGKSQSLVLDRVGGEGKDRLTIRPNINLIRCTIEFDHQEPGAPQFKRVTQVGLTKEGESFAAGGSAENLPKCILTGGAATMTVSYQGKSYPVCCSGCRDEFNDDPEKYAKKAALMAEQGSKTPAKAASTRVGKDDGAFEGLDEPAAKPKATTKATRPTTRLEGVETTPAPSAPASKLDAGALEAMASRLYRLGSNLEKSGKAASALKYYRHIIKEYPDTPSAKTAAARIKALGG
jgi:YHS domain-containing protein